ncbi:hypothetical protein MGG_04206 [Pyricularia oryzae 70-15]|uniref:LPXTG-domain-containing protein n=1 Tax=Pyricularia oryzae (strain 70-15 / ATCC MYA-4617 / FGSC 8958) TaxID=242507 RepID=G4NF70_PYRO7|nr:uncharacterized protein MGG_04206 [Pyricularia oryzae 70-15]EHA47248.1 hypothetical protein MGG_04206 [Pyricularia oryzae 70-15]
MKPSQTCLVLLGTLASFATSLLVAPNSPCSKHCGNVLSATTADDMECFDNPSDYPTTAAGNVLQNCLTCQASSPFTSAGQSDLEWLIYNLRYTLSFCLFGFPDSDKKLGSTPCTTSTACGPFREAIQWQNLTKAAGRYDFCNSWRVNDFSKCQPCLQSGRHYVLTNYMTMLDAACTQQPAEGRTISVSGPPFTTKAIQATTPAPTGYTFVPDNGPLNLGAKVGIAFAGVAIILIAAGCGIVCNGKRRRRRFLRDMEKRQAMAQTQGFGGSRWPGTHGAGGDMFETPVSQRPLVGGWEQSPTSAHTDRTGISTGFSPAMEKNDGAGPSTFPTRYYSPYSSPISAADTNAMQHHQQQQQWPAMTQEALAAMEREREQDLLQQQHYFMQQQQQYQIQQQRMYQSQQHLSPQDIGVALGGDDPSLRSKKSDLSFVSKESDPAAQQVPPPPQPNPLASNPWSSADVKGKHPAYHSSTEEYELKEVDSNGTMRGVPAAAAQQAPMLQHPGFGRYPAPAAGRNEWL